MNSEANTSSPAERSGSKSVHTPVLSERAQHLCHIVVMAAQQRHAELESQISQALDTDCSFGDVYEALTQSYLFLGFPAALEGLLCLHKVAESKAETPRAQPAEYDVDDFRRRGEQLCRQVYTTAYKKMRARLALAAPDLDQWMVIEGYGKTLARPQLEVTMREMLIVAMLCVGDWERQLYSHIRGALNVGVPAQSCRAVIELADANNSEAARRRHLKILDTILANIS